MTFIRTIPSHAKVLSIPEFTSSYVDDEGGLIANGRIYAVIGTTMTVRPITHRDLDSLDPDLYQLAVLA